jgi:hypothetical protein
LLHSIKMERARMECHLSFFYRVERSSEKEGIDAMVFIAKQVHKSMKLTAYGFLHFAKGLLNLGNNVLEYIHFLHCNQSTIAAVLSGMWAAQRYTAGLIVTGLEAGSGTFPTKRKRKT